MRDAELVQAFVDGATAEYRKRGMGYALPEYYAILAGLKAALAQGTEARRATTVKLGAVHDGPVAKPCARTLSGGGK